MAQRIRRRLSFDAWRVTYRNPVGSTSATTVHAYAVCVQT